MQKKIEKIDNQQEPKEKSHKVLQARASFEGPIPPPQILSGYKDIDSSFPDRILKMAEEDLHTRHNMNYLGWFGTYSLSLILVGGGIYLVANDKQIYGLIILAASAIFPILQLFFKKQSKKD
ncbi:hypothetical protein V3I05_07940 [Helicobacter mastomyrinus]|uniref:DUF2335 domain-containing protein n=1 Tax=Helicobacter mastomyrinus TaxID=287948 RepID=A0ABZ3F3A1_9HELI